LEKKPFLDEQDSILGSIYNETDWPVPKQRFLFKFPISWERRFQTFDDTIMRLFQFVKGTLMVYIDLAITALVAIETGIAAPFVFFILGWDGLAIEMSYLMLVLALFSQIPKRFIWRYRPYMVLRATKMRERESATTSSFPSRAVTCAVVYSYFVSYAYIITRNPVVIRIAWWMPVVFILAILLASFARINMGVHYPSDCVAGFIQGILVCIFGTLLWHANTLGCDSCYNGDCYSAYTSETVVTPNTLRRFNFISLLIAVTLGLLLTFISVLKPIDFWDKCDRVFGMLLPGVAFQVTLLCPRTVHSSLPPPLSAPWYGYIFGLGFAGLATLISYKNNGRYPVLAFFCLFVVMYIAIAVWRLWVMQ